MSNQFIHLQLSTCSHIRECHREDKIDEIKHMGPLSQRILVIITQITTEDIHSYNPSQSLRSKYLDINESSDGRLNIDVSVSRLWRIRLRRRLGWEINFCVHRNRLFFLNFFHLLFLLFELVRLLKFYFGIM